MSTVTVIEQPVTVTVEAGPTVAVTEVPVTVEVTVDGSVTVTEQPTTVLVQGGDSVTVQESPVTVEIDAVGHPRTHPIGGDSHELSGLTAGDVLTALTPTSAEFAPPAGGGGTPGDTVVSETTFGQAAAAGVDLPFSRRDHTHGSPVNPVIAHEGAGDPHAPYPLAAGAETITGVWTFTGLIKSNRAAATDILYEAYVAAQVHPQVRLATDTGLGYGPGTAAPIMSIRRSTGLVSGIAANLGWEFVRSTTPAPRLYGVKSTDTQPLWIWGTTTVSGATPGFALGAGGATAPDTSAERNAAGVLGITNALKVLGTNGAGFLELPSQLPNAPTAPATAVRLYARTFIGTTRPFYKDDLGRVNGPLGMLHGVFGVSSGPAGGLQVHNASGVPGLTGVSAFGTLGFPTLTGNATTLFSGGYGHPWLEINTSATINTNVGLVWADHFNLSIDPQLALEIQIPETGTATSSTTTTVTDSTKAWAIDEWVGGTIEISGEQRTITSNTATEITVSVAFSAAPTGAYTIQGAAGAPKDYRCFIGWTDQTLATMLGSDNPAGNYVGLQFSTARGDTVWQFVRKDGTTQTLTAATGGGSLPNAFVRCFHQFMDHDAGVYAKTFGGSWDNIVAPTLLANAEIPAHTVTLHPMIGIRNLAAANKKLRVSFVWESVL